MLKVATSGIGILPATHVVILFAAIGYYWHAYWHNTIDFMVYKQRLSIPTSRTFLKYLYGNSFLLFIFSLAVFIISIVIGFARIETPTIDYSILALSVVLALGALRLLTLPPIAHWRKRAH